MSGASTNPGIYPGNPSLPREVRDKILSTFKHTLHLYGEGKLDDCAIGCDFILKMDPRFSPARRLLEKTRNPAADVDVIELEAIVASTPARQQRPSADAEKLMVRAVESYNARDFDACINAAEQVLTAVPGNTHAADLLEKARRKKQAQGEFEASRSRAIALLEARRHPDAARELERMRSLDPDHPAVALLENRLAQAGSRSGAAAQASEGLGGMMDIGGPDGSLAAPATEPHISFGDSPGAASVGGGLDALSLDSLSLESPDQSTAVLPPPDFPATRRGPLDLSPRPAEGAVSPGDLWSESSAPEPAQPLAHPPDAARPVTEEDPAKAEREVTLLLKQGDDAAGRGEYEGAIEIWSRIFLIDINSVEAVTRIEKARQDMAEGGQQLSGILQSGRDAFEAGDLAAARAAFLKALAIDANEPTARSYLDRIEKELRAAEAPPAPEPSEIGLSDLEEAVPPAPADRRKGPAIAPRVNPRVAMIGAAFVALVAIGSWLVMRQPRPAPAPAVVPVQTGGSLEKATAFFQEGKIPETIAELKRIRPSDPDYAKARQLLDTLAKSPAETAAEARPAPAPAGQTGGAPPGVDPNALRARGEKALAEGRYIDALKSFSAVAGSYQGDPAFGQSMTAASEKVAELTPAVKLYNEAEYETAIPVLWRIYQSDKINQDARSYLLRCYANQGITELQNGLYPKAKQSFDEALALDPQDTEVLRHRKFAERYAKGDLDLLGRIYVRHLSHRP